MNDWVCPLPLRHYPRITLGHGGGGQLTEDLIAHVFEPAFASGRPRPARNDAAVLDVGAGRIAVTTDAHVVNPLEFPGGTIGELAVNGTINDLAMVGADPIALTAAFVLEEGLELERLARIVARMGDAARTAGVDIVAGDTKVVGAGQADGMYITTTGVGAVPAGVDIRPERIRVGDQILLSGPIGLHGTAVLSVREGLAFGASIESDTTPLHRLVGDLVADGVDVHAMRDLTRGGLATALCELATDTGLGLSFREDAVPVPDVVRAACQVFGLEPLQVANEGCFVAFVAPGDADMAVAIARRHCAGAHARLVGEVVATHPGRVVQHTRLGSRRVIERPLGENLPRIC